MELGPRDLENDQVTVVIRYSEKKLTIPIKDVCHEIPLLLEQIHHKMYKKYV